MPSATAIIMSTALATRRPPKRRRFSPAHPDLYVRDGGKVRLAIHDGDLLTGSLTTPGFATAVHPDWSAMSPLEQPTARIPLEKAV